jgi:hypothetical protein
MLLKLTISQPSDSAPASAAGVVYPREGATNKETGRRCERFGPLTAFNLDFSDKKGVQVVHLGCLSIYASDCMLSPAAGG